MDGIGISSIDISVQNNVGSKYHSVRDKFYETNMSIRM